MAALSRISSQPGDRRPGKYGASLRLEEEPTQGWEEPPAQFTSAQEGHDVERVTVVRTMSAVVKLMQENDESCVDVVGYGMVSFSLSAASRLRNAS